MFYFKEEGDVTTFISSSKALFKLLILIKIGWKIRKFLKFENTLTSFDECAIFEAVY